MMVLSVPGYLPGYLVLGYDSCITFVTPYPAAPVPVGDLKVTTLLGWQSSAFRALFCSFPNRRCKFKGYAGPNRSTLSLKTSEKGIIYKTHWNL